MKIKRFLAPDMRQALQRVREEQGSEAVILSSRNLPEGAEVVAAVDYDEALMQRAAGPFTGNGNWHVAPAPVAAPSVATTSTSAGKSTTAEVPHAKPTPITSTSPVQTPVRPENVGDRIERHSLELMRRELASMRRMIEHQMGQFQEDRLRCSPVRAQLLDELALQGIETELSRSVVASIADDKPLDRARGQVLGLLAKSMHAIPFEPMEHGGVVALVGPTGAGKTTTLAKMAAMYASTHSKRDVVLVSADHSRVGSGAQLQHYGRLLGMPVVESIGRARLHETLQHLSDYRLILVDCAGLPPSDTALVQQLSWLRDQCPVARLLVLPSHLQACDLDRMVDRFDAHNECSVVLSKLDEASRLGGVISVAIRRRLSLAYVTDGQHVPDDIHRAEPHRLLLKLGSAPRQYLFTQTEEHRHGGV